MFIDVVHAHTCLVVASCPHNAAEIKTLNTPDAIPSNVDIVIVYSINTSRTDHNKVNNISVELHQVSA